MLEEPLWTFFGYKIDMFCISCFIALFFLIVIALEMRPIVSLYLVIRVPSTLVAVRMRAAD